VLLLNVNFKTIPDTDHLILKPEGADAQDAVLFGIKPRGFGIEHYKIPILQ
jgi:hypothetical protein